MGIDITERKNAEKKIQALLNEKEILLKEVHHRIKNNMSVILSLFKLQSKRLKEPAAITALQDAESRVHSMLLLYDKLYHSPNFKDISILAYLTRLVDEIVAIFPNSESVRIEKRIDDFLISAGNLFSLAIITNELLTNAMKYAFPDKDNGMIQISAVKKEGHMTFVIQDNGVGLPETINIDSAAGFGLQLVAMLTKQLNGSLRIEREKGTRFTLEFTE